MVLGGGLEATHCLSKNVDFVIFYSLTITVQAFDTCVFHLEWFEEQLSFKKPEVPPWFSGSRLCQRHCRRVFQ